MRLPIGENDAIWQRGGPAARSGRDGRTAFPWRMARIPRPAPRFLPARENSSCSKRDEPWECRPGGLKKRVLYAGPWFHNRSASGGASSLLDPGGRGTMGLSGRSRAGRDGGTAPVYPAKKKSGRWSCDHARVAVRSVGRRTRYANSGRRFLSWSLRRETMLECIWLTRDSESPSVWPISFIVSSS